MKKISLISKLCEKYPQKILSIKDSPDILFAIGNLDLLNTFSLAVIGSRNCNQEAKVLTKSLVQGLVENNVTIISGMARGIDSIAHESAIEAGGKTIAIIGCGFIYAEDKKIFNKILENDGLILTEYYPDVPPQKFNFPRRNRLIAAISEGVIITQARENSGTLITAKYANEMQKNVFSFPWNIDDENYYGNNFLLANNSKCILSYKDVLKHYPSFYNSINSETFQNNEKSNINKEYLEIYKNLTTLPIDINTLSKKLKLNISELQYKLTLMELEGLVEKVPNNSYVRK